MNNVRAQWFDGTSPRGQNVDLVARGTELSIYADGELVLHTALDRVHWPELSWQGERQALLLDTGGVITCSAAHAWDRWARQLPREEPSIEWLQRRWSAAFAAVVLVVLVLAAVWFLGVPALSSGLLALVPDSVEVEIGEQAMAEYDETWFAPSELPTWQQTALRTRFANAVTLAFGPQKLDHWQLHFRTELEIGRIGANAFALPGGHIVVSDAMVRTFDDQPGVLLGVLGHELGHLEHRHPMDMLVRTTLMTGTVEMLAGDFSGLLASAPLAFAIQSYSRDAEREADAVARDLLLRNGIDPSVMVLLFDRLADLPSATAQDDQSSALAIGLASHPTDVERRQFFRSASATNTTARDSTN